MKILSLEFETFQQVLEEKYGPSWRAIRWDDSDSLMYRNLKRKVTLEKLGWNSGESEKE